MSRNSISAWGACIAGAAICIGSASAQAYLDGQWEGPYVARYTPTPYPPLPDDQAALQPVSMALLYTGRVLCFAHDNTPQYTLLIDPTTATPSITAGPDMPKNWFCGAMTQLADGRLLLSGGGEMTGIADVGIFDPASEEFTVLEDDSIPGEDPDETEGRYYASTTALHDGRILLLSGRPSVCSDPTVPEDAPLIFDDTLAEGSKWTRFDGARKTMNWYPFAFQTTGGGIYVAGAPYFKMNKTDGSPSDPTIHRDTFSYNVGTATWSSNIATALNPGGSAVMYAPDKILKGGAGFWSCVGSNPNCGTDTVYTIDLGASSPAWQTAPSMNYIRREHYFVVLPDNRILAVNGRPGSNPSEGCTLPNDPPQKHAEWYDPIGGGSWDVLAPMAQMREYHSTAALLPDARVMVGGGQFTSSQSFPCDGVGMYQGTYCYQRSIEIFSPPYLFDSNNNPAPRPTITSVPAEVTYGSWFNILTPQATEITRACLIRLGAATHSFDQNQRYYDFGEFLVPLGGGKIRVQAPPNGKHAPPGYYMLFILKNGDRGGIEYPSVAKIIKLKT